jgi:hypothetical protein
MADATEERVEYITIVGNSFDEVADECRAQRLHEKQYAIVSPIQRHSFTMTGSGGGLNGRSLVTATFARRT